MTCEHCKDNQFDNTFMDNGVAGAQELTLKFDTCNDAGCATPAFCTCECHNINVTGGAQ